MKQRQHFDLLTDLKALLLSGSVEHSAVCITSSENSSSFIKTNYPDLISAPDYSSMPLDGETKHVIETDCSLIYSKHRPLNPTKYDIAKREFDALLSMNIIRPSNSPWASPLHMVKKSNGLWRPCGDYRRLNAATVVDRYAVPNMQHIHHKLHGAKIFSTLDLVKA